MKACFSNTTAEPIIISGGPGMANPTGDLGFLTCAPDYDFGEAFRSMGIESPLPFFGGTSIADPFDDGGGGFETKSSFLRRKNVSYSMGVSAPLTLEHGAMHIQRLHTRCMEALGKQPALYLVMLPILSQVPIDLLTNELFALAGDIPVFGGLVSDEFDFEKHAVFANGVSYQDRMVLVAAAGDIRPTISAGCQVTVPYGYAPRITQGTGNIIERVDDMTFCEYLVRLGYEPEKIKGYPISINIISEDPPDFPDTNALTDLDLATGAGTFVRHFPRDASISVCFLSHSDIVDSTVSCIDTLLGKMAAEVASGYRYSNLLCVSCVARHYAMPAGEKIEPRLLAERLPANLNTVGYYSFGEVCPIQGADGRLRNRTHGHVIGLCAL